MRRRAFLALACAALAASFSTDAVSQAQSWPERAVKIILPYAPGGATDAIGRPWADKLSQAFGQQFVIENRGGAGGMIGAEAASKSPPDGYNFLLTPNAPLSVVPTLRKTAYDPIKSFDPVGRVGDVVCGFVIHPSVGIKTMGELIDYAKKNPGKLTFGSSGNGTANHMRLEMLKLKTGIDILHIPYRGGADTLNDVLPGTVHMMNEPVSLPHVKAGKLILLNINGSTRHPDFPDVADAHGTRHRRRRRAHLVLDLRAGRHAQGHRQEAERQDAGDRRHRRHEGQDALGQRLRAAAVARGYGQGPGRGHQDQRRADQGRQHQDRLGHVLNLGLLSQAPTRKVAPPRVADYPMPRPAR